MDERELQNIVGAEIDDAISFIDSDVGPERARAVAYYFGRPFGDEEDGRSQVVSRDVHDTINAALPSLMRMFFGAENVVEFVPQGQEDVAQAQQATDYVNYVVANDNDGFRVFYAAIKDALRSKVGYVKYWWDESVEVTTRTYTGLDEMALTSLLEDVDSAIKADVVSSAQDENGLTVTLKLKRTIDRARIEAVPPEELLIDRRARSIEDATLVAHRRIMTVSDLIALGYKKDEIESAITDEDIDSDERRARNAWTNSPDNSNDPALRTVQYVEAYMTVDFDGDGIAELRKVCTVGADHKVLHNEATDERPFADFHCDPEPHTFFGESLADKTMDVQLVKSRVLRASLDSLSQSIFPRTVVVDNDGNLEDAMNTEMGAVLRARSVNGYVNLVTPDVSQSGLSFLTYMDQLRENRTGMSKVSQGLDAEALQNTTATAAEGQFTRSQERIELIARIMASGMRRLFRGLLKILAENQRSERMVKLRNQWVPVDPRAWRTNMDVICTMGMGGGSPQEKMQALALLASKQENVILQAGPDNPLVTLKHLHHTYSTMAEMAGFRNPDAFFSDPESKETQERMANAPPPPEPPEIQKAKIDAQVRQAEAQQQAQLDTEKMQREHQLKTVQLQQELELKRAQLEAELDLKRQELEAELTLKAEEMRANTAIRAHQAERGEARADAETDANISSNVKPGGDPG